MATVKYRRRKSSMRYATEYLMAFLFSLHHSVGFLVSINCNAAVHAIFIGRTALQHLVTSEKIFPNVNRQRDKLSHVLVSFHCLMTPGRRNSSSLPIYSNDKYTLRRASMVTFFIFFSPFTDDRLECKTILSVQTSRN